MAAMTRKLKDQGREVIILSTGEPDFDTEPFIKEAGIAAIRGNETKYTEVPGTKALREALAEKFKRDNGINYAIDQIIVSSGLKLIIFNAIYATVDPGEEIIIPAPEQSQYSFLPARRMVSGSIPMILSGPSGPRHAC
jgi:aspartate aminotransferase